MYARSIAKSLVDLGCAVKVICGVPEGEDHSSKVCPWDGTSRGEREAAAALAQAIAEPEGAWGWWRA